jgi:hypothetical protein
MPPKARQVASTAEGRDPGAEPAFLHPAPLRAVQPSLTLSRAPPTISQTPQVASTIPERRKRSRHAFLDYTAVTPLTASAVQQTPAVEVAPAIQAAPILHSPAAATTGRGVSAISISNIFGTFTTTQTIKNIIIFGHDGPTPDIPAPATPPRCSHVAFLDSTWKNAPQQASSAPSPPDSKMRGDMIVCIPSTYCSVMIIQHTP